MAPSKACVAYFQIKLNLQFSKSHGLWLLFQSALKYIRIVNNTKYFTKTIKHILQCWLCQIIVSLQENHNELSPRISMFSSVFLSTKKFSQNLHRIDIYVFHTKETKKLTTSFGKCWPSDHSRPLEIPTNPFETPQIEKIKIEQYIITIAYDEIALRIVAVCFLLENGLKVRQIIDENSDYYPQTSK